MKLSGVATTIEIAWAAISGMLVWVTSSSSTPSAKKNATTLTVKKRAAWKPACPSRAPKVQWRFHQKLFDTPPTKGSGGAPGGGTARAPAGRGKNAGGVA